MRSPQFPISLFRKWPRLPFTARIERYKWSLQARSLSLQGWGLIDLPLRASNEGSPRPRVARAQKIISPHPLLVFVARLSARGWNPVALAFLPQGFARKPEDLRAGRAAAVHSLQHRQDIVFLELFPRRRQRSQRALLALLPRQPFAAESARFLWCPACKRTGLEPAQIGRLDRFTIPPQCHRTLDHVLHLSHVPWERIAQEEFTRHGRKSFQRLIHLAGTRLQDMLDI